MVLLLAGIFLKKYFDDSPQVRLIKRQNSLDFFSGNSTEEGEEGLYEPEGGQGHHKKTHRIN